MSSARRTLLQLAGPFAGQLSSSTTTSLRGTTTDRASGGLMQVSSNSHSSYSMPLDDALTALAYDMARAGADPAASTTLLSEAAGGLLLDPSLSATQGQPALQPRIVGGVEADTDRKYVCSLRVNTSTAQDFHYCGCSLISPSVVMTAAHCLSNAGLSTPMVHIGRYYQQQPSDSSVNDFDSIRCTSSVVNRGWSTSSQKNDIALCFLASASRFKPVRLGDPENTTLAVGDVLTVMGWGSTSEGGTNSPVLMEVQVVDVDLDSCNAVYSGKIGSKQICAGVPAGGKDACQGDSGGPLIVKGSTADADVQVGVVSFGIGCGRQDYPGVYTDVRAYREWVAGQMLARGVSYTPVTGGYAAAADAVDQASACACTTDGTSGDANVGSTLTGCKQHALSSGDSSYWCYVTGGLSCSTASASTVFSGAAWTGCDPTATQAKAAGALVAAAKRAPRRTARLPASG